MLRKELYTLGEAKNQVSKELELLREKYASWPEQIARLEREKHAAIEEKEQLQQDFSEAK